MNVFSHIRSKLLLLLEQLQAEGQLPEGLSFDAVDVSAPREASHGDMATNAAMVLAAKAGKKPRDLAELLKARLEKFEHVTSVEIAGPGFINLRFALPFWH